MSKMRIAFFIKFCRDFKIPLRLMQKVKVFNKACERSRDEECEESNGGWLTLQSFKRAIGLCFQEIQQ